MAADDEKIVALSRYQQETSRARKDITQDLVAREFAQRYQGKLLFCHETGSWFEWVGSHWKLEKTGLAFELARTLAREKISEDVDAITRSMLSKTAFATGVEKFCRHDRIFAVTSEIWDRDPFLLATPDGTLDLRTGVLRAATADDRITKVTRVSPSIASDCPCWQRFLNEATGGDDDLVRFLRQWCGYALTGSVREHALVFVYGPGGNGKSVFLNVVTKIVGDYAATAAMDTFTNATGERHPTDLAMLRGARLVTCSETEEGKSWAESRIKQLTGGDPITARFMRMDFFTFDPAFKLTIIGNHQPVLHNVDDAARRRFNIVPFTRQPASPDRELETKLLAEAPAILRWMVEGCLDWQEHGLSRPEIVQKTTEEYFAGQDLFGQWLDEDCDVERGNEFKSETSADLFASWSGYATRAGERPGSRKAFADLMQKRGMTTDRRHGRQSRYRNRNCERAVSLKSQRPLTVRTACLSSRPEHRTWPVLPRCQSGP
jgi:putative DNA primase/helicase